jgi:hypothetical protein
MKRTNTWNRAAFAVLMGAGFLLSATLAAEGGDPNLASLGREGTASVVVAPQAEAEIPPASPAGAPDPMLLHTYYGWDNWDLDKSALLDASGNLQFGIRLWEYSNRIDFFDRYVISPAGELLETHEHWIGVGDEPVITAAGQHGFLHPGATTQRFGVADSQNYIHLFSTSMQDTGWEIMYRKLDPSGNELIPWTQVTIAAHPWNFYVQPVVTHDGRVAVVWMRDTEDVCAIQSLDGGNTWSGMTVLLDRTDVEQGAAVKVVVDSKDSFHIAWRTLDWSTYVERLYYAKVRADWSLAVGETKFYEGPCWYPFLSLDEQDNIHVTFCTHYDVATELYYTRLRGDLDLDGAPATDDQLTTIPEQVFVADRDYVRYPMNLVDAGGTVHVGFESGDYGRYADKSFYYMGLCTLDGDLDCSEFVDIDDFSRFAAVMAGPDGPAPVGADTTDFANADLDLDGDVDLADFGLFLSLLKVND